MDIPSSAKKSDMIHNLQITSQPLKFVAKVALPGNQQNYIGFTVFIDKPGNSLQKNLNPLFWYQHRNGTDYPFAFRQLEFFAGISGRLRFESVQIDAVIDQLNLVSGN